MKLAELTEATEQNITDRSLMCCYYCLAEGVEPLEEIEFTGGPTALAICPRCNVDSLVIVDDKYSWTRLMAKHIKHFHFASCLHEPLEPVGCYMASCTKWNEYVKNIYSKEEVEL